MSPKLSEWLEIMLGEIARKREEAERAPLDERELRSGAGVASGQGTSQSPGRSARQEEPASDPAKRKSVRR